MLVPLKSEKRPKGEPMYRDPDNPFNTWTGIGKRPAWLTAKLDAGISLEAMKMQGVANPRPRPQERRKYLVRDWPPTNMAQRAA